MKNENRFTCISLGDHRLTTGDKLGNVIEWEIFSDEEDVVPNLIGQIKEEVVDIFVSGPHKVCRTISDKFYYWTKYSNRGEMIIVDCAFLNKLPCPEEDVEEDESYGVECGYKLSFYGGKPVLKKYIIGSSLELIDIETGDIIFEIDPKDSDLYMYFYPDGYAMSSDGKYYITRDAIWDKKSEEKIAIINTFGSEFCDENDDYDLSYGSIYSIDRSTSHEIYAFVDAVVNNNYPGYVENIENIENIEDIEDFYFVRIADVDFEEAAMIPTVMYAEMRVKVDFKIKQTEARVMSFSGMNMAAITDYGDIKIYNLTTKIVSHNISPSSAKETNEFGELI